MLLALALGFLVTFSSRIRQTFCSSYVQGKASLLVVAHPDDEVMFFGPILLTLAECLPHKTFVVSLSTGDHERIGHIREKEFYDAVNSLGIPRKNIFIIDDPKLRDGIEETWDHTLIRKVVFGLINSQDISVLVSFDEYGISSHPNHRAIYEAISPLRLNSTKNDAAFLTLSSVSLFRKYLSFLDIIVAAIDQSLGKSSLLITLSFTDYYRLVKALFNHKSQMVWFRWLYAMFSRYMFVNSFNINFISNPYL